MQKMMPLMLARNINYVEGDICFSDFRNHLKKLRALMLEALPSKERFLLHTKYLDLVSKEKNMLNITF